MPSRPRSHQLEDESITEFERQLPPSWVVRRKDHDYGVDLEVEIFTNEGRATGLTFNVQMKATDNEEKADKLSLSADKLEYYHALTVPTQVVRYCSPTKSIFHQWHMNFGASDHLSEDQQSFTYTFSETERWTDDAPAALEKTLGVARALDRVRAGTRIAIAAFDEGLSTNEQWLTEGALHDVVDSAPDVLSRPNDSDNLEVTIAITTDKCSIAVDCLSSITFQHEGIERRKLATQILYAVVALLQRHRLTTQAKRIARACLDRGDATHSPFVAFEATRALAGDLPSAVQLAVLNGLHAQENEYYGPMTMLLLRHPQAEPIRDRAVLGFFSAAREKARERGAEAEAAVCYSLANYYRNRLRYADAVQQYNQARRLRPAYCKAPYFVGELGAALFGTSHYRASAAAYRELAGLEAPQPLHQVFLADASLFSGKPGIARDLYQKAATDTDDDLLAQEASLKLLLCDWLVETHGDEVPTRRSEAGMAPWSRNVEVLGKVLTDIDALHEAAHYNMGIVLAGDRSFEEAFPHFLLAAFKRSGDDAAWANAIICAWQSEQAELVVATLACAISLRGRAAYELLRDELFEQGAEPEVLGMFDGVARELGSQAEARQNRDLTIRALRDHHYDITREVD